VGKLRSASRGFVGTVTVLVVILLMTASPAGAGIFASGYYFVGSSGGDPQCASRVSNWTIGASYDVWATSYAWHGSGCAAGFSLPAGWIQSSSILQAKDSNNNWYNVAVDTRTSQWSADAWSSYIGGSTSGLPPCFRAVTIANVAIAGGWQSRWDTSAQVCL